MLIFAKIAPLKIKKEHKMNDICVMILAAGEGTRMKSTKPKVLHEICGKSMLYHSINTALEISQNVVVILGFESERILEHLNLEFPSQMGKEIKTALQDRKNLPGTAGAVMAGMSEVSKDTLIITCADMPLITANELKSLANEPCDVCVGAFELENPFGYGRVVIKNNKVEKIVEEKDASENEKAIKLCNSGAYAFKTALLKELLPQINKQNASKEYYLTDAIALAIKSGAKVSSGSLNSTNFMGVNDKIALAAAQDKMLALIRQKWMRAGVIMHLPNTIYIDTEASFEGECEIESAVVIKGASIIKNSVIKSGSVIESSLIENSDIGPNAHLRPKSNIKDTHIGNFVELKNATLNGVKAGHLSYLGDCEIDSGTNIGCGTITCNYDGVKKHRTIIGKNVFVGSDTAFVAPINIADNTLIAAGSVVTKDSSEGELVITRAKQQNIAGYFEKKFGKK